MQMYFRQTGRTEEYCRYAYFTAEARGAERLIIFWFADQTVRMYDHTGRMETGRRYPEKEIIDLFLRYVAGEGFPEQKDFFAIPLALAEQVYNEYLKGVYPYLLRLKEKEQEMETAARMIGERKAVEEVISLYTNLAEIHRQQGRKLYQGAGAWPREPVTDPRTQQDVYEIESIFIEAGRIISYRLGILDGLRNKTVHHPFAHAGGRSILSWRGEESYPSRLLSGLAAHAGYTGPCGLRTDTERETDCVNYTVLSPVAVQPDSYGVIECYMYADPERPAVEEAIRAGDGLVRETTKSGFDVERDTAVTVWLESDQAKIRDPMETRTWKGKSLLFDFQFYVPENYGRSRIAFTCHIEYNGIPVTRMNFLTAVSRADDRELIPAKVARDDFRKAFISYSRKDEQRMLARVLGIQEMVPGMKFWLDRQSMDAGDLWREEIRKAILISDMLLLFWSVAASRSPEVEKEWRYGLEQKGLSFIAPVPLDPPDLCPPPEPLEALNFSVRAFGRNDITQALSFFGSRNITVIEDNAGPAN